MAETIAELYSRYWEYTYSGHTARLLQQVLDGFRTVQQDKFGKIVDAGSGPLILDRVMRQETEIENPLQIISVDINNYMLENGVTELERLGHQIDRRNVIHGQMANMNIQSGSADAVVCSLAFHYSNSTEDRGRILTEANRVLRKEVEPFDFKNAAQIWKGKRAEEIRGLNAGDTITYKSRSGTLTFIKIQGANNILIRGFEDLRTGDRLQNATQVSEALGVKPGNIGRLVMVDENRFRFVKPASTV